MIAKSKRTRDGRDEASRKVGISLAVKATGVVAATILFFMMVLTYLTYERTKTTFGQEIDAFGVNVAKTLAAVDVDAWDPSFGTLTQAIQRVTEGARKYPEYLKTKYGIVVDPPKQKVRRRNLPPEFYRQQEEFLKEYELARARNLERLQTLVAYETQGETAPAEIVDAFILLADQDRSLVRAQAESPSFRAKGAAERHHVTAGDRIVPTDAEILHGSIEGIGKVRSYTYPIRDQDGEVTHRAFVFLSQSRLDQALNSLLKRLFLFLVVFLVLGSAVTYLLTRWMTAPILKLVAETSQVKSGSQLRSHVHTDDEIGLLARAMDSMVRRLEFARQQHDQELAADVHKKLAPEAIPYINDFNVDVIHRLSDDIGATYYDFLELPNGRWGFVVAQGSQKGVAAAMNVMTAGMLLRLESREEGDPVKLLASVNDSLFDTLHRELSVSALLAVLDPASSGIKVAQAGSLPLLFSSGKNRDVDVVGQETRPLGQVRGKEFARAMATWERTLEGNDRVFLTNGAAAKIRNEDGRVLGQDGWLEMLDSTRGDLDSFVVRLRDSLHAFTGNAPVEEDIIVVTIHAKAKKAATATA